MKYTAAMMGGDSGPFPPSASGLGVLVVNVVLPIMREAPERAGSVDFVSGRTRLYGIVGHPIEQVRSPETLTYELRKRGLDAILLPIHIEPDAFDEVFPQLLRIANLDGLVITVPHKPGAVRHVARTGPLGEISRSISVIGRTRDDHWVGEMFDGVGCVASILRRGVGISGSRVMLYGAGGAGAAIAVELARHAPASLTIFDPNHTKLTHLIEGLRQAYPAVTISGGEAGLSSIDLLVNASPVGMLDESLAPISASQIPSNVVVMDAIMKPDRTKLLRIAEESGCLTVYGREMLDSQIARACDFLLRARTSLAADFEMHPDTTIEFSQV
jgi:shikimate dehydrogenase